MSKDTGGPAFPLALGWIETDQNSGNQKVVDVRDIAHGMSLRDYLAAKAMQASRSRQSAYVSWDDLAKDSYEIADAMLDARAQS